MTARLSPAQQRVVDAMRDGAELLMTRRDYTWRWVLRRDGHDDEPVHGNCARAMTWHRIVIQSLIPPNGYVLAPEYREAR